MTNEQIAKLNVLTDDQLFTVHREARAFGEFTDNFDYDKFMWTLTVCKTVKEILVERNYLYKDLLN
jgi:hypothetical protein